MREVRKRTHDTAEQVDSIASKVAKLSNLPVVMPAVVGRIATAEAKVGHATKKQGNSVLCSSLDSP